MVDPATFRRWLFRAVFVALCAVVIFGKMLPLSAIPRVVPGPDLIFAFTAAFIMRRPRYAPVGLIVVILLLTDILFLRPIGLWPAIAVVGFEIMRNRSTGSTETPLPVEIFLFSAVFTGCVLINALILLAFGLPLISFQSLVLHVLVTLISYPLVLLITHYGLRVRRARPTDVDAVGGTL